MTEVLKNFYQSIVDNAVLVSGVQQSGSVTHRHTSTLSLDSFSIQTFTEYRVEFPIMCYTISHY